MGLGKSLIVAGYMFSSNRRLIFTLIGFQLIYPLAWLIFLKIIGSSGYLEYFIVGTMVNASFLTPFVASAQEISWMRHGSRLYSLLFSNGAGHVDIALGYVVQNVMLLVPNLAALLALSVAFMGARYPLTGMLLALASSVMIGSSSTLIGYALAMSIRDYRAVNQLSQIIGLPLIFLSPTYYPLSILPPVLRYVSYALPTTYMALAVHGSLMLNARELYMGLLGLLAYSAASVLIARYAIYRGEVSG